MSQSMLKRHYKTLGKDNQSFREFVIEQIELCREQLDEILEVASKDHRGRPVIYCLIRHVSRSGMSRTISLHYIDLETQELRQLNYVGAVLLGLPLDELRDGIKVTGCGMDMGFHLVSTLSRLIGGGDNSLEHHWI